MSDPDHETLDEATRRRVLDSFGRQTFLRLLGAEITDLAHGSCAIELTPHDQLQQQHGYVHAGVVSTLADTAAGYAALSVMPADASVLTTEFKINLLAPAAGEMLRADARVVKPGRTLVIVQAEVSALREASWRAVALFQGTMICLRDTADDARRGG